MSFRFAFSVLLGSERGHIPPLVGPEVFFTIVLQLIGCVVFGLILGSVTSLLMEEKILEQKVACKLGELREYLQHKNVTKPLRHRVYKYMELLYDKVGGFDADEEVLRSLPSDLASQLLKEIHANTIIGIPLFEGFSQEAVLRVCFAIRPVLFLEGDYVSVGRGLGICQP
jgi:hypothetical protein